MRTARSNLFYVVSFVMMTKDESIVRVSRDREHGFHRIVSKYFAGS